MGEIYAINNINQAIKNNRIELYFFKSPNILKLKNIFLNNPWIKKIQEEGRKVF